MEWISVDERKPKLGLTVLVSNGQDISMAYLEDINQHNRYKARTRKDKYPIKIEWQSENYDWGWYTETITHWMELPQLPEKAPVKIVKKVGPPISKEQYAVLMNMLDSYPDIVKSIHANYKITTLADLSTSDYEWARQEIKRLIKTHEQYLNTKT